MIIKTRFAPSPTGYLHIEARTALFSWIFALKHQGEFLRLKCDSMRSTDEYSKLILDSLDWLGIVVIKIDFYQMERLEIYTSTIG